MSNSITRAMDARRTEGPQRPITRREAEVISLVCRGSLMTEIAENLGVARVTVVNHVKAIRIALGKRTTEEVCFEIGRELGRKEGK